MMESVTLQQAEPHMSTSVPTAVSHGGVGSSSAVWFMQIDGRWWEAGFSPLGRIQQREEARMIQEVVD